MSTIVQRTFSGGELSPAVQARVDLTKYQTGLKTCRNMTVMRHGGAQSRAGTSYVATAKQLALTPVRLIPFIFNQEQTYVLEFGQQYIRLAHQGAQLRAADYATVWGIAVNYVQGDIVSSGGSYYYCILAHVGHVPPNFTYWYLQPSPVIEIPTLISSSDLADFKYAESNDVITLVHPSYSPLEFVRTLGASAGIIFLLRQITFASSQVAPASVTLTGTAAGANSYSYAVTAVSDSGEESAPITNTIINQATLSSTNSITIAHAAVSSATSFNVYRLVDAVYEFLANVAPGLTVIDRGATPDTTKRPTEQRNPFSGADNYPSSVAYAQQRLYLASSNNSPQTVWASRIGSYHNFSVSTLSQDDDAVTFTVTGRQVNEIEHILDLGSLLLFTPSSELAVTGDQNGVVKPSAINVKNQGNMGASSLTPLLAGSNAVYVQSRGSVIRDLFFQIQVDGYRGDELSIFASHLVDGFEIVDWSYSQIPHSIIWAVRSDGVLLGLTYVPTQQIIAWHRHDFPSATYGIVKNVCVVPEDDEDVLYLAIERIIGGVKTIYIERMATRFIPEDPAPLDPYLTYLALPSPTESIADFIGVDSSVSYDGRNFGGNNMEILGGVLWDYTETLTLGCTSPYFVVGDEGYEVHLTDPSTGDLVKFSIVTYVDTTHVTGKVDRTVPTYLQSFGTFVWSKAVNYLGGLNHLIGENVSVLGDGQVQASANNEAYPVCTVGLTGSINFTTCYSVIQAGLAITCDLETLNVDQAQGESIVDKSKLSTEITLTLEKTRGVWAGPSEPSGDDPLEGLSEMKVRQYEGYDDPVALVTGTDEITISPTWTNHGGVFIRQVDPLPMTVLSVAIDGLYPFKSGG